MTNSLQRRDSNSWIQAGNTALALALILASAIIATQSAHAQTFTVLHTFTGTGGDGAFPYAGLVRDAAGNLYGTTGNGGDLSCNAGNGVGCGTVFKLDTTGVETVLYSFTGSPDGAIPGAGLVRDATGNLYGTTAWGGDHVCDFLPYGCGTVFKLDPTGKETVLHSFTGAPDGEVPGVDLFQDAAGNLYGTANGVVFEVDTTGKETLLYTFNGGTDGGAPSGVIRDAAGDLYGVASCCGSLFFGNVFKLDTTGAETVLYNFTGARDGAYPRAGLFRDDTGDLYGTTYYGGALSCLYGMGCGTVFKLDTTGAETILYRFKGTPDGAFPFARLFRDAAGNLYGTTYSGGGSNLGTVFKLDATGKRTVLHSFTGAPDGANPYAGLIRDAAGNLYGTTGFGGDLACLGGCGVVFELSPRQ